MKRCSAQAAVDGTLRQYWHCDRAAGHEGQHLAVAPNGAVLKRWESS